MSKDEKNIKEGAADAVESAEPIEDDLFDDAGVDEDVLEGDLAVTDEEPEVADLADNNDDNDDNDDNDSESDTEALDDLEAEELEMLTEDEASETIVVDEETQLRDIRRAQISIEASSAGGATDSEFVCSKCFLVKKSSQMSNRRKKICLDCAS